MDGEILPVTDEEVWDPEVVEEFEGCSVGDVEFDCEGSDFVEVNAFPDNNIFERVVWVISWYIP